MRSPVIAFSLFAAATVVSGAPAAPATGGLAPKLPVVGSVTSPLGARAFDKSDAPIPPSAADVDGVSERHAKQKGKRAYDYQTAGGNSYTGSTSNTSGGTVVNEGGDTDTLTNTGSNTGGTAGDSESGDATGGDGRGHGPGGNAYTGNTGQANGGAIINESGSIANTAAANTAGNSGASDSGDAVGGDAVGDPDTTPVKRASEYATANGHAVNGHANGAVKRASDYATAGGNAYTGSTGNTGSGNIVNEAGEGGDDTSTLTNTGPSNDVAAAGDSTSGDAEGGRGDGKGPGGNGYSGHAGPARGGNVINEGGTIGNTAATNIAGAGADSTSGDSEGGSA